MAVSGGYYMAAAANRIYTSASAYVGNIGTRGPRPDDTMLTPEEMSSGPFKLSGGSRFDRVRQLELVAEAFVSNVIAQRQNAAVNPLKIDKRTVEEARIYLGSEAVAIGLADLEGGRSDAILDAAELAGVSRYTVADLAELEGLAPPAARPDYTDAVKSMVETAPPEAVFLLDARLPLPGLDEDSEVVRHLLQLRGLLPAATPTPAPVPTGQAAPALPEGGA
jgi:protease-4